MIGHRINNYEIVDQIGEGGMGAVYMARHPFIDRKVAVKVLRASLANDPAVVQRFFNEAKAANAIRHPNIIDILDVGLLPDGRTPYLMMELLEGENVAQRLKRVQVLSVTEAVSIGIQTASAVAAAHDQGIVHRDLKPENLFIVRDQRSGDEVVKVLDFGIAKLRGTLSGNHVRTQTGALMGTPPYMSPEQCRGISTEVDHRTDIYATGIILYEMLCGSPPFVGEGFGDVLVQHLTRPPDPPRSRNPAIPGSLERVILRALAKTLDQRYVTMKDLQSALEGKPVPDAPPLALPSTTQLPAPSFPSTTLLPAPSIPPPTTLGPTQALSTVPPGGVAPTPAGTPPNPFQRQTTTLTQSTGEMDSAVDLDNVAAAPRSRRNLFAGAGVAAAAAAVALILLLRTPAETDEPSGNTAAGAGTGEVVAINPPPQPPVAKPDAGAATAAVVARPKPAEVVAKPTKKNPPAETVATPTPPKPRPTTPRPRQPVDHGMGKW